MGQLQKTPYSGQNMKFTAFLSLDYSEVQYSIDFHDILTFVKWTLKLSNLVVGLLLSHTTVAHCKGEKLMGDNDNQRQQRSQAIGLCFVIW